MRRDLGVAEAIRGTLPESALAGVGMFTQLGDVWFLAVILVAAYALRPRDREGVAFVAGVSLVGAGVLDLLKATLARPRPPMASADPEALVGVVAEVYRLTATADGYGLPSGHAMLGAVVYLGLAAELSVGRRRTRLRAAGVLAVLVGASRVVLGVHYLVDVIVGLVLGVGLVAVGLHLRRHLDEGAVPVAFAVGLALALLNAGVHGLDAQATALVGATVGAVGGWHLLHPTRTWRSTRRGPAWRRVGAVASVLAVVLALMVVVGGVPSWLNLGLGIAVAVGVAVGLALIPRP
ncbi:MAG: phosphatase PAP2 family protein [Halobacteriales archaeon]